MSMFTGLKAVNHFGRPDMSSFLKFVQKKHSYVSYFSRATNKTSWETEENLEYNNILCAQNWNGVHSKTCPDQPALQKWIE